MVAKVLRYLKSFTTVSKFFVAAVPLIVDMIFQACQSRIHRYTYKAIQNPQNIIVIGGSFGGLFLANQLANSVPTGHRVILIEKKSHFNFTWIFPRVSVVQGHEHKAFIPYGPGLSAVPTGSLLFYQGTAVTISENTVTLQDGTAFEYKYLAIATGSTGTPAWRLATEEKRDGIDAFRKMQRDIREAQDIIIVGGGAVGVELASDVKSLYSQKNVSLIHSRDTLLNSFGPKLHGYVLEALQKLGVNVYLGERVKEENENETPAVISLKSGKIIPCELMIKCTGQRPASELLSTLCPSSISTSGMILVQDTLQIMDSKYPQIYALGDVAETGGVRMGRAAGLQAGVVSKNIIRAIKGRALKKYKSMALLEGGIDLTLGLGEGVLYFRDKNDEFLIPRKKGIALDSENAWKLNGARPFEDKDYDMRRFE